MDEDEDYGHESSGNLSRQIDPSTMAPGMDKSKELKVSTARISPTQEELIVDADTRNDKQPIV